MTKRHIILGLGWLAIVFLAGTTGRFFFGIDFWSAAFIAGGALILNGFVAEWEDRQGP